MCRRRPREAWRQPLATADGPIPRDPCQDFAGVLFSLQLHTGDEAS